MIREDAVNHQVMTVDINGSIHSDTTGRFTGRTQAEADLLILPAEPAWYADVREAGLDPETDVVHTSAAGVTSADVAVVEGRLVSMTRKRCYGAEVRFRFYAGNNEYGSLVTSADTPMTVVRPGGSAA